MQTNLFLVKLHLAAPVLSQLSGGRAYGVDIAALRSEVEMPALPGSLVRGNLRHVWQYFIEQFPNLAGLDQQQINTWLGEPSPLDSQDEPKRARLYFSYYWQAETPATSPQVRHRILIDNATGTVAQGALQVIEEPFSCGAKVCFSGTIRAQVTDEAEAKHLTHWLRKGLEYIPALGAFKGTGFGRVLAVNLEAINPPPPTLTDWQLPQDGMIGIRLQLDRPLCFARHHHTDNRFESVDFIPGAAIRGALAHVIFGEAGEVPNPAYPKLNQYFDKIYIKHALPVAHDVHQRPVAIPWSFVSVPHQSQAIAIYDLSMQATAGLIYHQAPTFPIDWKKAAWQQAAALCGHSKPPERRIQVRTAINPLTGTTQESALFAMEMVQIDAHHWMTTVNCRHVPAADRVLVLQELQTLFSQEGLVGLGKTKALATVQCLQPPSFAVKTTPLALQKGDKLVLILQSAAQLLPNPYDIPSTNGNTVLQQRYTAVWQHLSQQSLELSHYYARQQLAGGVYLQQRFWHAATTYNPVVLTLPGSVFVFQVIEPTTAQSLVTTWLMDGLPQLPETFGGENWQQNPYIAANGYGEILVNPSWDNLTPTAEAWLAL